MSPTNPGRFINDANAKNPAEPHIFLPSGAGQSWMPDKAVSGVPLATSPRTSGKVDSPRAELQRNFHSRPFDPFDDPCNYLG